MMRFEEMFPSRVTVETPNGWATREPTKQDNKRRMLIWQRLTKQITSQQFNDEIKNIY